jgi:hypothetical protein
VHFVSGESSAGTIQSDKEHHYGAWAAGAGIQANYLGLGCPWGIKVFGVVVDTAPIEFVYSMSGYRDHARTCDP